MSKNTITMTRAKELLNYTIANNIKLQENGDMPIAFGLEATPGIGKTSLVEQVAHENGMSYVKLNLGQLEEAGDLTGYPLKEFEVQTAKIVKGEDGNPKWMIIPGTQWLSEKQLDMVDKNTKYKPTGNTRMSYARPAWVPEYNEKGTIFNLDDFSRANSQLLQATMELILTQGYFSWTLPKKTTVVLTSNSDDGTNNVSSLDSAQRTRFMNFEVEFDIDAWTRWAEESKIDSRCITFVNNYFMELFNVDEEGNAICNPRSFVMFAKMIAGIKDWEKSDNLEFITSIARGCFKDDGGRFAQMFSSFIRNKMHLLITPREMLLGDWEKTKAKMEEALYDGENWRPDIAALLERRFANFVLAWLGSDKDTPIAKVKDRLYLFLDNKDENGNAKKLFNNDQYVHMLKTITSEKKSQTGRLLVDPRIAKILS